MCIFFPSFPALCTQATSSSTSSSSSSSSSSSPSPSWQIPQNLVIPELLGKEGGKKHRKLQYQLAMHRFPCSLCYGPARWTGLRFSLQAGCWPVILLHLRIVQLFLQSSKIPSVIQKYGCPILSKFWKISQESFSQNASTSQKSSKKSHGKLSPSSPWTDLHPVPREVIATWSGAASSMPRIQSRKAVTCNVRPWGNDWWMVNEQVDCHGWIVWPKEIPSGELT